MQIAIQAMSNAFFPKANRTILRQTWPNKTQSEPCQGHPHLNTLTSSVLACVHSLCTEWSHLSVSIVNV